MSARAKRGVKKQYEEVESDIDMSETEREMKKEEQGENDQGKIESLTRFKD